MVFAIAGLRSAWISAEDMNRSCRIAMVGACPLPYDRGTPIRIFRMAEALANYGCDVHVFAYHLGSTTPEEERRLPFRMHRIRNVPTYQKYSPGPSIQKLSVVDPLLFWKLKTALPRLKVDLIHAHHYEGLIISLLLRKFYDAPIIYDAHTLLESELHFYLPPFLERLSRSLGQGIDKRLPPKADHIITVTPDIRDKLLFYTGIDAEKISVIMNGIEWEHFNRFQPAEPKKEAVRKIVYAGNLGEFQGIADLLHICAHIFKRRADVKLQIITSSSFEPYRALARKLQLEPRLEILTASYPKLPEYLHAADVLLNPRSECDGIPQKLLNYMASGRPVVSFRGSAKLIEHHRTGYIVENGNHIEFARAVLFLLDHGEIAEKIGARAKEMIYSTFSWESRAGQIVAVYNKLLGGRQPLHRRKSSTIPAGPRHYSCMEGHEGR